MRDSHPPDAPQLPLTPEEDWGRALSALPLDAPPAGGWERVSARMPRRRSPARYWVPAAVAASLAVLLVLPWKTQDSRAPDAPSVASTTPPVSVPASTPAANHTAPAVTQPTGTDIAVTAAATDQAATNAVAARKGKPTHNQKPVAPVPSTTQAPAPRLLADAPATQPAANTQATSELDAPGVQASYAAADTSSDNATASVPAPTLEDLYAESARLEALLSQIRDDRVSSGTAMALSADLHDRIANIDTALSQPNLGSDARLGLWRDRVAALQRLTGVETTQRWMAANGYLSDGQVAQIY